MPEDRSADRPYPAPFDTSTFLFPVEWHGFSDLLGGNETGLIFLKEGSITHINQHLAEQLEYDDSELVGQPVELLFPEGEVGRESRTIRLRTKSGKILDFHFVANRIDALHDAGSTIWILRPDSGTTHIEEQHTFTQTVTGQDLTSEKKRQLHYLNRLLRLAHDRRPTTDTALRTIVKSAAKAIAVHRCAYWEVSEDIASTRCMVMYDDVRQNFTGEERDAVFDLSFHPLLREIVRNERQFVVADVDVDPRAALHCEYFHARGIKAMMAVPVQHDGASGRLLLFDVMAQTRRWRKDEVEFGQNVAALLSRAFQHEEHAREDAHLRHLAHHDSLTGLPNRHFLFDQAADFFPKVTAGAKTLAAFFIDLDGFKSVNDAYGHAVGDELLRAAALRLKNVVRKDDVLIRLGGDEFMLLARDLDNMRIADEIAQEIVESMHGDFALKGHTLCISASVGIAIYPFDGTDIDTLMKKADVAMYHAKSAGRDQYRRFAPQQDKSAALRSALEADLRRAIEENELVHFYQPQVDLRTGKVRCVEALLRWRHPQQGLLMPAAFLPLAEETGIIRDISAWVLHEACDQLNEWIMQDLHGFTLAINLSASQLMDRSLLSELEDALDRTHVPAHFLEWEVKESTIMQHHATASSLLDQVSDMRIGLSIDDFGTGYSSMAYLRHFPVRKVKIDGSFVDGLPEEKDDCAITQAIISMAKPLGLDVVAEGVETPQQMEFLRAHGCDLAQGFLFSQPLTAEQLETWLIRH